MKTKLHLLAIYIFRRGYGHLFFFHADANLSRRQLFSSAFAADFALLFLSVGIVKRT